MVANVRADRVTRSIRPGALHLYVTRTSDADDAACRQYESWLTEEERARWERFRFERNRREFLVTRGLARATLARYGGCAPEEITFAAGRWGKPFVAAPEAARGLSFNLSNTSDMIVLLVAAGIDVGVDVERVDRRRATTAIAHRHFAPAEVDDLLAQPPHARDERFFAYWTLKEAYIKARGMGLALPLDGFAFHIAERITIRFAPTIDDDPASWRFGRFDASEVHRIAWAARTRDDVTPVVMGGVPPAGRSIELP